MSNLPGQSVTGKPIERVDGRLKVTGGARYAAEIPIEGVVHGVLVQSSIASGRIKSIDTSAAESAPGVLAIITHLNAPRIARPVMIPSGESYPVLQGPEISYNGQNVAVVIADSLPRAEHAAKLVRVEYETSPHAADLDARLGEAFMPPRRRPAVRGNIEQGLAAATTRHEATYSTPIYHHNAMEPHATLALWEGDLLTAYNSTQQVFVNRRALAAAFGISPENVRVINHFVGGGFGSKGWSWQHTVIAAMAARVVRRPVKLALTREQMYVSNGHRPKTFQKISLGANAEGRLTAIRHDVINHTSIADDFVEASGVSTPMLYSCPNLEVTQRLVRLNVGTPTATRAPGEASGSFALESAMDELAYALKIDPIELRLRNYAERHEGEDRPFSSKSLRQCYHLGAAKFGWDRRTPEPRSMRDGRYLVGMGMASATYPAYFRPSSARARLHADGSLLIQTASHDLGTGTYTILSQIAADTMGVPIGRVRVEIGDTSLPEAVGAGGSMSAASVGSAVQAACLALQARLIELSIADPASPLTGKTPEQIKAENGRLFSTTTPTLGETYLQFLARRNEPSVEAQITTQQGGARQPGTGGPYAYHAFGAHFIEVQVDPDLGQVRVTRALGTYGVGRILNQKTARSQMEGGIIWGIGMGLLEATHLDGTYGRYTNSNLTEYLVPVNADIPPIEVVFVDEVDPYVNPIGAKGIGEIGIVGVAAAVANAVYHATGKRVRHLPITVDKLL
jgi:xanthine dehydrogenase YagR molybdenum-binding subunit